MAVVRQLFDDCTLNGLKHAWRTAKIEEQGTDQRTFTGSRCGYPAEIPVYEGPDPFKEQKTTHVRRCPNCTKVEEFNINSSGSWKERQEKK